MRARRRIRAGTAGRTIAVGAATALAASLATAAVSVAPAAGAQGAAVGASASANACLNRANNTYDKLLSCVTLDGVRAHQKALQAIADANDDPYYPGTRAAGTKGYEDSVAYVSGLLRAAGYQVRLDPFEFEFAFPAVLEQVAPVTAAYPTGSYTGSGSGDVTAAVTPVDIVLAPPRTPVTSGCEAADFAGFPAGNIALLQRGTCPFVDKAVNAEAAGAAAVIIFNQGNDPDREGLIIGTLGGTGIVSIPVVGASFAQGEALAQAGSRAHVNVQPNEVRTDYNVIADLPGRNRGNVVMSGAHLDSVGDGPGINDNGSGASAILETALMMANIPVQNSLRFAFWGAEEEGLIGSTAYVEHLPQSERDKIALYMNYDMVGSPNYIQMVYDADQSSFASPVDVPDGSTAIEDLYESYYTMVGEPYDDSAFDGRSDYQAFIENGIASGGLFTGAEVVKTAAQQAIWGGTAGESFDPCYHQACDDYGNVDLHALDVNSDLIAFAQLTFAFSTESVNGVPGKRVPGPVLTLPAPAGPQGTFLP